MEKKKIWLIFFLLFFSFFCVCTARECISGRNQRKESQIYPRRSEWDNKEWKKKSTIWKNVTPTDHQVVIAKKKRKTFARPPSLHISISLALCLSHSFSFAHLPSHKFVGFIFCYCVGGILFSFVPYCNLENVQTYAITIVNECGMNEKYFFFLFLILFSFDVIRYQYASTINTIDLRKKNLAYVKKNMCLFFLFSWWSNKRRKMTNEVLI